MRLPLAIASFPAVLAPCSDSGSDGGPPAVGMLERPADTIVMTGAELPQLTGLPPDEIVAFRWTGAGGWEQVPVQIDERAMVSWLEIYGGFQPPWELPLEPDEEILAWCDADTFTGPDPEPAFDENDELALAAIDVGARAHEGIAPPAGVLPEGGVELSVLDPVDGGMGWLYLLRGDGSLDPAAGEDRVSYSFALASGLPYLEGYQIVGGPNPEVSAALGERWRAGFADRWILDELRIQDGTAEPADLLDRLRASSGPPECTRTEDTYSGYTEVPSEGAFLANVDGPVRALRSLVGANSGILTHRDVVMSARRIDVRTFMRVHPIEAHMSVFDLSLDALGSRYHAPWAEEGIAVDGDPNGDPAAPPDEPTWEVLTGPLGTLAFSYAIELEEPGLDAGAVFGDDLTPHLAPCTGDPFLIGSFGMRLLSDPGNTDPQLEDVYGVVWDARVERRILVEGADPLPPDEAVELGELFHERHENPLQVAAEPYDFLDETLADGPPPPPAATGPPERRAVAAGPGGLVATRLEVPGAERLRWSVATGELPYGLELDPAGFLRGRTFAAGTRRLTLRAVGDVASYRVELELELTPEVLGRSVASWVGLAHRGVRALGR